MRRLDDTPLDPEIEATLDAIDATLAGEPVDPRFAELAELALLLADERPRPREQWTGELDARVQRRFAPAPAPAISQWGYSSARPRRRWSWGTVGGGALAAVLTCALAALIVVWGPSLGSGGSSSSSSSSSYTSAASTSAPSPQTPTPGSSSGAGATASASSAHASAEKPVPPARSAQIKGLAAILGPNSGNYDTRQSLSPATNGRVIVQSAELDLAAAPSKVDQVAQEVFNVVGAAGGIVDHSSVTQTGGSDGYANFQLRIPSNVLSQTLGRLSNLTGATVVARTDTSQDVNSQWISLHRQLADDRALRAALLKQLAAATTTGQIDSLNARIHDAESAIAADEANINSLSAQVNYSKVVVNINAQPVPPAAHHHSSGGLTLGHSAHIAGRVLVVAAGIALIVLAGLVPVGLLAALGAWIAVTVRRRRREQALDLA